jgi:hypothetical protein
VVAHEMGAVEFGPWGLTPRSGSCTLNKLPWIEPVVMVRDGVCLFFENSTVCRNVSAMFCFVCLFLVLLVISAVLAFVGGCRVLLVHDIVCI